MKKFISLCAAFAVLASSFTFTAFAAEDAAADVNAAVEVTSETPELPTESAEPIEEVKAPVEKLGNDVKYASDYKFVESLGIFELVNSDQLFWKKEAVTRGEFATLVAKMLNVNTSGYPVYSTSPFTDITKDHFAYPSVCYLTDLGIIHGDYLTATYRPDDSITVAEASKLVMAALGYSKAAETNAGGYPLGYVFFAKQQGIYDGLSYGNMNATLSALETGKMIRNALDANVMQGVEYLTNGVARYEVVENKTLLLDVYDIKSDEAVVTATYDAYLSGDGIDDEGRVEIGASVFDLAEGYDINDLLGYQVKYYYKDTDDLARPVVVFAEPSDDKTEVIELSAKDIADYDETRAIISYDDPETGKDKDVKINGALVSYNGKPRSDFTAEDIKLKEGNIKLICYSNSSRADVVIIEEYVDVVFERLNSQSYNVTIQNPKGDEFLKDYKLSLDEYGTSSHISLYLNGKEIAPTDLQKNDVLTVVKSLDGEYIKVLVSRDTVDGTVTGKKTKKYATGSVPVVIIDGKDYEVSAYNFANVNVGDSYEYALTFDGRLIGANKNATVKGDYAYLIKTATNDGNFDTTLSFKFLTDEGDVVIYDGASKIKTNYGVSSTKVVDSDELAKHASNLMDTIVMFTLDANNKVKALYFPGAYTGDKSEFALVKDTSNATYANNMLADYMIDDTTKIFVVPPKIYEDDDANYAVYTKDELSDGDYAAKIYDVDDYYIPGAVVVKLKNESTLSDSATVMVVDEVMETIDENNDTVTAVSGYVNGELVEYKIDEEVIRINENDKWGPDGKNLQITGYESKNIISLQRGWVIQFGTNFKDNISRYRILFMPEQNQDENHYSAQDYSPIDLKNISEKDFYEQWKSNLRPDKGDKDDKIYTIFGKVVGCNIYNIKINADKKFQREDFNKLFPTTKARVYQYDPYDDEIKVSDIDEIEEGDIVFMHTRNFADEVNILLIKEYN